MGGSRPQKAKRKAARGPKKPPDAFSGGPAAFFSLSFRFKRRRRPCVRRLLQPHFIRAKAARHKALHSKMALAPHRAISAMAQQAPRIKTKMTPK